MLRVPSGHFQMAQGWAIVDCSGAASWSRGAARTVEGAQGGRLTMDSTMGASMDASRGMNRETQIADAYRVRREIARKEARNFYYSFVALPEQSAMPFARSTPSCGTPTIYLIMKVFSIADCQTILTQWLDAWHNASQGAPPMIQSSSRCAMRRNGLRFHRNCWSNW